MIGVLLAEAILKLFTIMAIGFAVVKLGFLKTSDARALSLTSMYITSPCVILSAFQVEATPEVRSGLLLGFGAAIAIHALLMVSVQVFKRLGFDEVERNTLAYTNGGNLIIPLAASVLGDEYVIYTVPFMAVQLCCLFTFCQSDISGENMMSPGKIIKNINVISIAVGIVLFLTGIRIPGPVGQAVDTLGSCIGPICMLVTGILIAGLDFSTIRQYRRLPLIVLLRMGVIPLLFTLALKYLPLSGLVENGKLILMITLMACTAQSSSTVTQMAQIYNRNSTYASLLNAVTTFFCILTMPLCIALYQM